jgi:hypothetical protein
MQYALKCLTVGLSIVIGWPSPLACGNAFQENSRAKPLQLSIQHDRFLQRWLATHPDWRLARVEDCEDRWIDSAGKEHVESCQRLVQALRAWTKDPAVNPFYARGDFNRDENEDFAVVLTHAKQGKTSAKSAKVVVFNGPFQGAGAVEPAYSLAGRSVSETFLGYGPPRAKPWRLIIGSPESEGRVLIWSNGRYVLR